MTLEALIPINTPQAKFEGAIKLLNRLYKDGKTKAINDIKPNIYRYLLRHPKWLMSIEFLSHEEKKTFLIDHPALLCRNHNFYDLFSPDEFKRMVVQILKNGTLLEEYEICQLPRLKDYVDEIKANLVLTGNTSVLTRFIDYVNLDISKFKIIFDGAIPKTVIGCLSRHFSFNIYGVLVLKEYGSIRRGSLIVAKLKNWKSTKTRTSKPMVLSDTIDPSQVFEIEIETVYFIDKIVHPPIRADIFKKLIKKVEEEDAENGTIAKINCKG